MASHVAQPNDATYAPPSSRPAWGAVYAMALCTFTLIASEFMPVSLLSPIAATLRLSEGQAGQAIAVSGVFAVLTSLSIASVMGASDRRRVMLGFTALLIVSGTVVALAPNYPVLMIGRAVLGIVIGGFWSMSVAVVMRLVPAESVPKGLAILNGGIAIATTLAAPVGSYVGGLIGWRGAFFCVVPSAIAAVVWLALTVPPLPPEPHHNADGGSGMFALLRRPPVLVGMTANLLMFTGQFALFTYLRPFLEQVTRVSLPMLSTLLLVIGVAGFVGSIAVSRILKGRLYAMLAVFPGILALVAFGMASLGQNAWVVGLLLAAWGFVTTAAQVAWWSWLARTLPDDAEKGGGLLVAVTQLAITVGATLGGTVFDAAGPAMEFAASGVILLLAAGVALAAGRQRAPEAVKAV